MTQFNNLKDKDKKFQDKDECLQNKDKENLDKSRFPMQIQLYEKLKKNFRINQIN